MNIVRFTASLAAALVLGSPAAAASLSAFGRLPAIETILLSPNGQRLAMIRTDGVHRKVEIADLQDRQIYNVADESTATLRGIQWADDSHLIVTASQATAISGVTDIKSEWSVALVYDLKTRTQKPLLGRRAGESLNVVLDRPQIRMIDGKLVAFVLGYSFPSGDAVKTLFRTDLDTGLTRVATLGSSLTETFLVGDDGKVAAEVQYDTRAQTYVLKLRDAKGALRAASPPQGTTGLSVEGFTQDGASVLVRYWLKDNEGVLAEASADGAPWRTVEGSDEQTALFDSLTNRMVGLDSLKGDIRTVTYADPKDQRVWNAILKAYPGSIVIPVSYSALRRQIVVHVDSATEGPAYELIDLDSGKSTFLGALYGDVTAEDISPVRPVRYKAADGTEITGYLTLPRGRAEKGLPLIVLPHGGPASRDEPGFDWWSQALASRGYAVLRPNFRGSTGYGRPFFEAGFGEFGRKMQTDLSDGVRYLAGEGIIDAKRVCIVGASYGGYAALAGAALDTGVYTCAASLAGPADLRLMLLTERDESGFGAFSYWTNFMGVQSAGDPALTAISPAAHAAAVTIPLLLVHGKDDTVVLYSQSRTMADAMKKAGKPVEFVTLDGEDHWLSSGVTRLKMLEAVTAFVEKNNPPG